MGAAKRRDDLRHPSKRSLADVVAVHDVAAAVVVVVGSCDHRVTQTAEMRGDVPSDKAWGTGS